MNNEFVYTYKTPAQTPSLKAVVFAPIIYLFGTFALSFVIGFSIAYWSTITGISEEKFLSSEIVDFGLLIFCLFMIVFLVKRFGEHLFLGYWKNNFYSQIKTGLKWSIPYIILCSFLLISPVSREGLLEAYLYENNLLLENITILNTTLISTTTLVGTFLEELIFRGMIQRYINNFVNPRISVLIASFIFTIAHIGNFLLFYTSIVNIASVFMIGIFTGFAFNKANSCISAFIPHLVANSTSIIIVPIMLAF